MKKIRGEQENQDNSENTSSEEEEEKSDAGGEKKEQENFAEKKEKVLKARDAARMEREAEEEREAIDCSYEEPDFEHGGTHQPRFERIKTGTEGLREYDFNPYDIDRVNTRASFERTRSRSATGSSLKKTKSGKSFKR